MTINEAIKVLKTKKECIDTPLAFCRKIPDCMKCPFYYSGKDMGEAIDAVLAELKGKYEEV